MLHFGKEEVSAEAYAEAAEWVANANFIVALTGAGISQASGVPLLENSLNGQPLTRLFDKQLLRQEPKTYYELYSCALAAWRSVLPNPAHYVLSEKNVWVVTLNIDGLHRDAGTKHLIEMHGNLRELRCLHCAGIFGSTLLLREMPPKCPHCAHSLVPGLSMQGDEIRHYSRAMDWVGRADLLIVIGTSLHDAPANRFPEVAKLNHIHIITVDAAADRKVPKLFNKHKAHPED